MSDQSSVGKWMRPAQKSGRQFLNPVPTAVGGLSMLPKVLPLYLRNRAERTPREPLGPFRTEAEVYGSEPEGGLRVTWFGHSSMLVEIDGVRVLMDPVWDERASPWARMGPKRFFPPTIELAELPKLDAVLLSHDHYDHLGVETIRELAGLECAAGVRWITSCGVGALLERWGVARNRVVELNWTERVRVESARTGRGAEITAVPARHFSGRSLWNRFETLWSSFVLRGSEHTVYFGADSGWWEGFGEIAERYGPFDLAMLEIGAYHQLWEQIHLGPEGAARAFRAMGSRGLLMPIHWGLFDLALHAWRQPIEHLLEIAGEGEGLRLWCPEPGRPTEVVRDQPLVSRWWQGGR